MMRATATYSRSAACAFLTPSSSTALRTSFRAAPISTFTRDFSIHAEANIHGRRTSNHPASVSSTSSHRSNPSLALTQSTRTSTTSLSSSSSASFSTSRDDPPISSSRGRNAVSLLPVYLTDARAITRYHPIDAPDGALQLSVAENQMLEDLLVPALRRFSSVKDGQDGIGGLFHSDQIYYQSTHGREGLRRSMAGYLQKILKLSVSMDVEGLVLGAGCNAVLENLCFCLTEPGDGVLVPTPYYAAFEFDLVARAALNIIPVHTMSDGDHGNSIDSALESSSSSIPKSAYFPNRNSLNAAYQRAKSSGTTPKILLLSHPNNPLGVCYPPSVVKECIDWAREMKVHLVSDEIYAGSVYESMDTETGEDTFQSALALASTATSPSPDGLGLGPYVHFVYALSKDFALSGLRVGVAYSENKEIRLPMQKLNDLCQISSQTQLTVEQMLSANMNDDDDSNWATDGFLPENNDRIRDRSVRLQDCLDECGIPHLSGDSCLFVWMDFSEFLPDGAEGGCGLEETQESMDKRERALYLELMREFGLLFTPGRSMRNELPGFFRCVFTAASDDEFALGLERIRTFISAKRV